MTVHDTVRTPKGFVSFCERNPGECSDLRTPRRIELTDETFHEITKVHVDVNRRVRYVADNSNTTSDYWTLPEGEGDCEDIALEKRRRLIEMGYPRQALLLTIAKTRRGTGIWCWSSRRTRGDYVLDNRERNVVPWSALNYRWVKQQSRDRGDNQWVALRTSGMGTSAGRNAQQMTAAVGSEAYASTCSQVPFPPSGRGRPGPPPVSPSPPARRRAAWRRGSPRTGGRPGWRTGWSPE